MQEYIEVKNTRAIFIKYLGPTNHRGSRIKFQDNYRSGESKTVSYSYLFGNVQEQALQHLKNSGFNVVGRATTKGNYIFFVENWSEEYKYIKEIISTNEVEKIYRNGQ
jgi:hypothetical protein